MIRPIVLVLSETVLVLLLDGIARKQSIEYEYRDAEYEYVYEMVCVA
jgi:hypothetical protein